MSEGAGALQQQQRHSARIEKRQRFSDKLIWACLRDCPVCIVFEIGVIM